MVRNDDRPLKIINTFENKSAAVVRLSNYDNTFLYVLKKKFSFCLNLPRLAPCWGL